MMVQVGRNAYVVRHICYYKNIIERILSIIIDFRGDRTFKVFAEGVNFLLVLESARSFINGNLKSNSSPVSPALFIPINRSIW